MSLSFTKKLTALACSLLAVTMFTACSGTAPNAASDGASPTKVAIGVGGQTLLTYLPTTLAAQLGYYEDEGLDVELQDLQGGSKALTALVGGSVEIASGYYEHTIQMQAKQQSIKSFVQMGKSPGLALVVAPGMTAEITSLEDLKGKTVGVTAPGSSTDMLIRYLLVQAGMQVTDVSVAGIGAGSSAVAAMQSGEIAAGVMLEPDITVLAEKTGSPTVTLADTRTPEGLKDVYGSETWSSSAFYAQTEWLEANPETAQKLANALTKTLQYIADHDGAEIAAEMPESFAGGDLDRYATLIEEMKAQFTTDGRNTEAGTEAVLETQRVANPEIGDTEIDLSTTYTNEFVGGE